MSVVNNLVFFVSFLSLASLVEAQTFDSPSLLANRSLSRIAPPEATLGTYIIDHGNGLNGGCSYRTDGPLLIDVDIPMVVNSNRIDANGYLINYEQLISTKVIGKIARIFFPAYDVDDKAVMINPGEFPEVDKITFNGKAYGKNVMDGFNNVWNLQSIDVPINEIKFGSNKNLLRVDIDTANAFSGKLLWCTAIDWVGVSIDVAAPYVLAHGIAAQLDTWNDQTAPGVLQYLDSTGIRWTRFSVAANGSVIGNARLLANQIFPWLTEMKSDRVNIIAHSKGGLDAQAMAKLFPDFKVLSLATLSTPYQGSVTADLNILERQKMASFNEIENSSPDPGNRVNGYLNDSWQAIKAGQAPEMPGIGDLRTFVVNNAFALGMRGNINPTFTIGANADENNNNELDNGEGRGMFNSSMSSWILRNTWHVMRNYSSAQYVRTEIRPGTIYGTNRYLIFSTTQNGIPQNNDIVVTTVSANPSFAKPLGNSLDDHSSIKNVNNVRLLVEQTVGLR